VKRFFLIIFFLVLSGLIFSPDLRADDNRVRIDLIVFTMPMTESMENAAKSGEMNAEFVLRNIDPERGLGIGADPEQLIQIIQNRHGEVFYVPRASQNLDWRVGMEMVSDVQYFKPNADGTYTLEDVPWDQSAGFWVYCRVSEADDPDHLVFDYELTVRLIKDRETLPGVNMNVGRPVFLAYQENDRVDIRLKKWFILEVLEINHSETSLSDAMIIMVQLNREK